MLYTKQNLLYPSRTYSEFKTFQSICIPRYHCTSCMYFEFLFSLFIAFSTLESLYPSHALEDITANGENHPHLEAIPSVHASLENFQSVSEPVLQTTIKREDISTLQYICKSEDISLCQMGNSKDFSAYSNMEFIRDNLEDSSLRYNPLLSHSIITSIIKI